MLADEERQAAASVLDVAAKQTTDKIRKWMKHVKGGLARLRIARETGRQPYAAPDVVVEQRAASSAHDTARSAGFGELSAGAGGL